jgi:hypothetical protein
MFGCVLSALPSKCLLRARAIHCATLPLCTRHPPQVFARISSGRHPTTCAVARVPRRCVSWPRRDRATARCRVAAWTRRVNCGACQEHFVCRCAASPEARLTADTPSQPLGATTPLPAAGQQLALATRRCCGVTCRPSSRLRLAAARPLLPFRPPRRASCGGCWWRDAAGVRGRPSSR